MSILENVNNIAELRALPEEQLPELCSEIRAFLIESLSKTGGHLASNLGTVELTVALDRVYDPYRDRIVFDVGHQCYTHKLLTGRREGFDKLRKYGGISGFPKPSESEADAFIAGHASNSVSVALGMARARTRLGGDYDVVAIIGDGALTGGLAYEGLSNAGQSGEPLVVILNDNAMSIGSNVGGMARLLSRMRVKPGYFAFKRWYRSTVGQVKPVYDIAHRVKEGVKGAILPENMFDDLGFYYLGPIDGHDVAALESAIAWARDMRVPVLLHVITQKGRGCSFAEADPEKYHGVGPFDPVTGAIKKGAESFSAAVGAELCREAEGDERIAALTAAMAEGTGLARFARRFPERFFDTGIAEGHTVAMAAGMAKEEKTIYFRECIGMLVLETILYFFTIALYYLFVAFVDFYVLIGIIAYLYAFFAPAFQLFCFYQVYQGTKSPWRIAGGALRSMVKVWKAVIKACAALAVVYCMLYIFSMGLEVMISSLLPHVLILNIGVTMNRWMEVGTLLLSMVTNQLYDSAVMMFLLIQVIAAVLFSCLYVLWMGWIAALCESAWNSRH